MLFRLAAAYERRSLVMSSHWPFDQWGRFLPELTIAVSLLDRLRHYDHVVVTDGESYRMRQAPNERSEADHQQLNTLRPGTFTWPPAGTTNCLLTVAGRSARGSAARRPSTSSVVGRCLARQTGTT